MTLGKPKLMIVLPPPPHCPENEENTTIISLGFSPLFIMAAVFCFAQHLAQRDPVCRWTGMTLSSLSCVNVVME